MSKFHTTDLDNSVAKSADAAGENFYSGDTYTIEESVGYLIKQAKINFSRTVDEKMAALDLTSMQWGPLLLLAHGKAATAAELSRCYGVETSTMTRMLDRLETKGLIERKRNATDRRVFDLALTEEGQRLAAKIPYLVSESLNHHLHGFTREEFETFKSLLKRYAAAADAE